MNQIVWQKKAHVCHCHCGLKPCVCNSHLRVRVSTHVSGELKRAQPMVNAQQLSVDTAVALEDSVPPPLPPYPGATPCLLSGLSGCLVRAVL